VRSPSNCSCQSAAIVRCANAYRAIVAQIQHAKSFVCAPFCQSAFYIPAIRGPRVCSALDRRARRRYRTLMSQSILVFDFGTDEKGAQLARHKIEAWQQSSRLGKKVLLKFEREESASAPEAGPARSSDEKDTSSKKKNAPATGDGSGGVDTGAANSRIRVLIRLDFSDHEKLMQQRWLDRIVAEEPFKSAKGEVVRRNDGAFVKFTELFDSLD
jgi:hypothetical protein